MLLFEQLDLILCFFMNKLRKYSPLEEKLIILYQKIIHLFSLLSFHGIKISYFKEII